MYLKSFDETKIFYSTYPSENPLGNIVIVHGGFQGNHTLLKKLIKGLSHSYNVYAPDLRGKGDSDFPKRVEKTKLEDYATDIYELIKKEKIESPYLVGVSFGGVVTLKFAELFSKKTNTQKIVLISSTNRLDIIRKRMKIAKIFTNPLIDLGEKVTKKKPEIRKNGVDYSDIHGGLFVLKYTLRLMKNNSLRTTLLRQKMMKVALDYKIPPENLQKIKNKFLLIHGDKDEFFPLAKIGELINNTNNHLKIIKNGSHNIYLKHPRIVSKLITDFFSS